MRDLTAQDALRKYQKQLDPEGIEVGVSRQALDETLIEIYKLQARIAELESPWIPVSERLPESGKAVQIARFYRNGKRAITRGFYSAEYALDADNWEDCEGADYSEEDDIYYCPEGWHEEITSDHCDYFYPIDRVTHWKPLPQPPEDRDG